MAAEALPETRVGVWSEIGKLRRVLVCAPGLAEVVADDTARTWVLDRKITDNIVGPGVGQELRAWLDSLPAAELANYLIGGVAYHEIPKEFAGPFITSFGAMSPAGFLI